MSNVSSQRTSTGTNAMSLSRVESNPRVSMTGLSMNNAGTSDVILEETSEELRAFENQTSDPDEIKPADDK